MVKRLRFLSSSGIGPDRFSAYILLQQRDSSNRQLDRPQNLTFIYSSLSLLVRQMENLHINQALPHSKTVFWITDNLQQKFLWTKFS